MTNAHLDAVIQRMNATGFGPWQLLQSPGSHDGSCIPEDHWTLVFADEEYPEHNRHIACLKADPEIAEFIAHARMDMFYLLSYVQHLHQLAKDAYIEGYQDALMREAGKIPHVLPYGWGLSQSRKRLHEDGEHLPKAHEQ